MWTLTQTVTKEINGYVSSVGNIKYILSGHVQRLINEEKLTQFIKREEKNRLQQYFESTDNDFKNMV